MMNLIQLTINSCIQCLQSTYLDTYGNRKPEYVELMGKIARLALGQISGTDALYHDVEHTILVTLVGQEILRGKHLREGSVTCEDWLHAIASLLCHDVGYIKGACQQDSVKERCYVTGTESGAIALPAGATDASLTPYHVDRGKLFVEEYFSDCELLDLELVKQNIELTRFPVPPGETHRDTSNYPGLVRAADLIGQLSDPNYLQKMPALFYEFEENGTNKCLGYQHPGDLRAGYPNFFWNVVYKYIQDALHYLEATERGQDIIGNLYLNVSIVEQELADVGKAQSDRKKEEHLTSSSTPDRSFNRIVAQKSQIAVRRKVPQLRKIYGRRSLSWVLPAQNIALSQTYSQ